MSPPTISYTTSWDLTAAIGSPPKPSIERLRSALLTNVVVRVRLEDVNVELALRRPPEPRSTDSALKPPAGGVWGPETSSVGAVERARQA